MPILKVRGEVAQGYIPGLLSYRKHFQNLKGRHLRTWTLDFEVNLVSMLCECGDDG